MKNFTPIFFLSLAGQTLSLTAQPTSSPELIGYSRTAISSTAPKAWLGFSIQKPDETITAHVPSLPQGLGFIITAIDPTGPGHAAELHEMDIIWKFGDQKLVNEAQLAALLRLSKPGQIITLSGFRAGKPLEVKLTLGQAPALKNRFPGDMLESTVLDGNGNNDSPIRVIDVAQRSATFSSTDGSATVRREETLYKIKINGPHGEPIFENDIPRYEPPTLVPEPWRTRIQILCRTLDQSLDGGIIPRRQPRPRVIPPPSENP